jgi:DNA-binding LacI/PurR family transcriptional regulator
MPGQRKNRITAEDVARQANVSQSTVSRVFSKDKAHLISKTTQDRVRKAAEALGYQPDPIAQALKKRRTGLLGVIVQDGSIPFYINIINALYPRAEAAGFHLIYALRRAESNHPPQASILDIRYTDGIFIFGDDPQGADIASEYLAFGQPVVSICQYGKPKAPWGLTIDNASGLNLCLTHLKALGHQKIGFVTDDQIGIFKDRLNHFRRITRTLKVETTEKWIFRARHDYQGGYDAMITCLEQRTRPTAIIACDDVMAIGMLNAALSSGITIPESLSIVGFDDIDAGKFVFPPLTTLQAPTHTIAETAIDWMSRLIRSDLPMKNGQHLMLKPHLVERSSSGKRIEYHK